jgi:hypothetical protein
MMNQGNAGSRSAIVRLAALLAIALTVLPSTLLGGHDGLGGIGLDPAHSVRSISMGETGLMETGNAIGFGLNPGALPFLDRSGLAVGYRSRVQGLSASRSVISGVLPIGPGFEVPGVRTAGRRFGLGFEFDHSGLELSQGSSWATEMLAAGAGYRITPYASVGILVKMLFTNTGVEGTGASAFGVDLSALVELRPDFSLAFAVRNPVGSAGWDSGEDESLPLVFSLGGHALLPREISADLTVSVSGSDQTRGGLGIELPVLETGFSLRGGYLYQGGDYTRNVPTFGLGFDYADFEIDYAVRLDDELALGTTHHFALTYLFDSGF